MISGLYFFSFACLHIFCSFCRLLKRKLRLLYWFETFLSHLFMAIKFLLSTALGISHQFWCVVYWFSFSKAQFLFCLRTSSLTGLQVFGDFPINFPLIKRQEYLLPYNQIINIKYKLMSHEIYKVKLITK